MKFLAPSAGLLIVILTGCASQPPSPLRVDLPSQIQISQVVQTPQQYQGTLVRWGGVIANVKNLQSATELEIVGKTLDRSARPVIDGGSTGRFLARIQGFLEPTEYAAKREITVVGTVSGSATRPIGEFEYTYAIIDVQSYNLWAERVEPKYYYDPWFYDPWYWGYPRYPWWYYY